MQIVTQNGRDGSTSFQKSVVWGSCPQSPRERMCWAESHRSHHPTPPIIELGVGSITPLFLRGITPLGPHRNSTVRVFAHPSTGRLKSSRDELCLSAGRPSLAHSSVKNSWEWLQQASAKKNHPVRHLVDTTSKRRRQAKSLVITLSRAHSLGRPLG